MAACFHCRNLFRAWIPLHRLWMVVAAEFWTWRWRSNRNFLSRFRACLARQCFCRQVEALDSRWCWRFRQKRRLAKKPRTALWTSTTFCKSCRNCFTCYKIESNQVSSGKLPISNIWNQLGIVCLTLYRLQYFWIISAAKFWDRDKIVCLILATRRLAKNLKVENRSYILWAWL